MTAAQARGTNISTALDFLFFLGSIEERMVTLQRRWEQLIQSNAKRKQRLLDSLQLQVTDTADLVRHLWILNFTPCLNMNQKLKLLSIPTAAHFLFVCGTELHSPRSRWCTGDKTYKAITIKFFFKKKGDSEWKISTECFVFWLSLFCSLLTIVLGLNNLVQLM